MRISVMTNMTALGAVRRDGVDLHLLPLPRGRSGWRGRLRARWDALWCDYVLVNCSPRELFELAFLKLLVPFAPSRLVSLDTVLPVPATRTARQRAALALKRLLFRKVHLFIEYFRDTRGYVQHYGMDPAKFRYVPFKINRYERVLATPTSDAGYIFCGGNTRRDFHTLIAAVRDLPYPVRIVTMSDRIIAGHGSVLDERDLPAHVEVVRHDGSESFLDHVAGARLVALPIRRENISASGIGVYLASMALGKCVVISAGPAVDGIVPPGAAVIVPPEDPGALREALDRVWNDATFRHQVAEAGRAYALTLGGEARLGESILDVLLQDRDGRQ